MNYVMYCSYVMLSVVFVCMLLYELDVDVMNCDVLWQGMALYCNVTWKCVCDCGLTHVEIVCDYFTC